MGNYLVFGGNVFVGRAVAEGLIRDGHTVYVLNRGNRTAPSGCIQLYADRSNFVEVETALGKLHFDAVFDISAYKPEQSKIAVDCLMGRTRHFIHISTAAVYINSTGYPFSEDSATGYNPAWGEYSMGKFLCEQELLSRYEQYNFPITIFRPFYIYGPGNNLDRETYIFRRLLQKKPIIIPGYGRTIVQFGHIDDLVNTLMQTCLRKESVGQIYNVSGGEYITLQGWVETCAKASGLAADIIPVEAKQLGFEARKWFPFRDIHLFGSCNKLKKQLGITPEFSLLKGLEATFSKLNLSALQEPIVCGEAELAILKAFAK